MIFRSAIMIFSFLLLIQNFIPLSSSRAAPKPEGPDFSVLMDESDETELAATAPIPSGSEEREDLYQLVDLFDKKLEREKPSWESLLPVEKAQKISLHSAVKVYGAALKPKIGSYRESSAAHAYAAFCGAMYPEPSDSFVKAASDYSTKLHAGRRGQSEQDFHLNHET